MTVTRETRLNKHDEEAIKLRYGEKDGNKVRRFGFHNLRHSLASFLTTKKKKDVKTDQRSLRHSNSSIALDKYVQTDMDELVAAQELRLDAIFQHNNRAVN